MQRLVFLLFLSPLWVSPVAAQISYGLEWPGTGAVRRMLYWSSPPAAYDMTYLFKVYQRNQVTGVGDGSRYYTTFFHGNNGTFVWGGGYGNSYYGAHPYPVPAPEGNGKWEISTAANDFITRDDASEPYVANNQWYSQAFLADNTGGNNRNHVFYIDLPSVTTANIITHLSTDGYTTPPSPAIVFGQAPDNGSGASWGGYSRWEEQNAIIRGIQIYTSVLTEAQIIALAALDTDAAVNSKVSELSITSLWYLNMNPRPSDVTDKKSGGVAHNPAWEGTTALEWSEGEAIPDAPTGLIISGKLTIQIGGGGENTMLNYLEIRQ